MSWLILFVVLAALALTVALLLRRRVRADSGGDNLEQAAPRDLRGYRLVPGPKACGAALRLAARPLAPDEAAPLPLTDCASRRCRCRYEPLAGKRRGERREQSERRESVRYGEEKPDRRSGRERRKSGRDPWGRGRD